MRKHSLFQKSTAFIISAAMLLSFAGCGAEIPSNQDSSLTDSPKQSEAAFEDAVSSENTTTDVQSNSGEINTSDITAENAEPATTVLDNDSILMPEDDLTQSAEDSVAEPAESPADSQTLGLYINTDAADSAYSEQVPSVPTGTQVTAKEEPMPQTAAELLAEEPDEPDYDTGGMTSAQREALNMLNYLTVLTQEISNSSQSRLDLDAAYSALLDNIFLSAVDTNSKNQINSLLNTIYTYRMIDVKREQLTYIYQQNQARNLRQMIPNPVALLSVNTSGNLLSKAASLIYMATDSVTGYESAKEQASLQYLQDGWELDKEASDKLHDSRVEALNYMHDMIREYNLPEDYALKEKTVKDFVDWKENGEGLKSKIEWFETKYDTYKEFGPYWLVLAELYFEEKDYRKCLDSIKQYETVSSRIFSIDKDLAEILPNIFIAARSVLSKDEYKSFAEEYIEKLRENITDNDWSLQYFSAQVYLDLYARYSNKEYLDKAYGIVRHNVNVLKTEQRASNEKYQGELIKVKADKGATKQQKDDVKKYNQMLQNEYETALPPVNEALYLNCELFFALADEMNLSKIEKEDIDDMLYSTKETEAKSSSQNSGETPIFLTSVLNNRFRFYGKTEISANDIETNYSKKEFEIPASCVSDHTIISVCISGAGGKTTIDDWTVKKVNRNKSTNCADFMVIYESQTAKDYSYSEGDKIAITVTPVDGIPELTFVFNYSVVSTGIFKKLSFERE